MESAANKLRRVFVTDHIRVVGDDFEEFLAELYGCRVCSLSCEGAPAPPAGRIGVGASLDVLLVGWNPQVRDYARQASLSYEGWRAEAASELERASVPFRHLVGRLLPLGVELGGGRVANTRVWKWPTATKTSGDSARAGACAEKHLWREVELLRPRLILTYDKNAADFFLRAATARGVPVDQQNSWPSVVGWAAPHRAWGWPMALLLITGKRDKTHEEIAFISDRGAKLLEECVLSEPAP